jgi:hypothetical protein
VVATVTDNEGLASAIEALEVETERLGENERRILVVIDNYDTFADEARNLRNALPILGQMARQWGTDGLHFVVAGSPSIVRSPEDLRKQVQMPRLGIALQTEDAVMALNGRIPRSLAQAELPPGRGFVVRSGRTVMLQIATPYPDDERQAESLDQWVQEIRDRYPGQEAPWWQPQESEQAPSTSPESLGALPEGIDLEALKKKLVEAGMDDDLLALLSPIDVVNVARELNIPLSEGDGE